SAGGGTVLRATSGAASGRMDLLTVVTHELGHLLGRPDLDAAFYPNDIMADSLATGMRRLLQEARPDVGGTLAAIGTLPPRLDADRPMAVLAVSAPASAVSAARQRFLLGEAAWSIPAAPPNPGPSAQPSRNSSALLLGGLDGLIRALQAPAVRDSDLVRVLGRWGTQENDHPLASNEAKTASPLPRDTHPQDAGTETAHFASGNHRGRDWLFAHPDD